MCFLEEYFMKKQATGWKKIFPIHIYDKMFIYRKYEEC